MPYPDACPKPYPNLNPNPKANPKLPLTASAYNRFPKHKCFKEQVKKRILM